MFTNRIKNSLGGISDQAVLYVNNARMGRERKVLEWDVVDYEVNLDNAQVGKLTEESNADESDFEPTVMRYSVKCFHNGVARQQGFDHWMLKHEGDTVIEFEIDDKYASIYDRAGGNKQQKLHYTCEQHLKAEVLPKHQ